ncbi:amino acid permease [Zymomonas sp.]|uniref:amino acid permease n=1 Tax=Zymomonas sp. TaxID=2068624 RepID=UPI0025E4F330|nr:amino acid permease [Zymomonas sp.]MCA1956714.1 amino acid permease [Zymomonas sp.]
MLKKYFGSRKKFRSLSSQQSHPHKKDQALSRNLSWPHLIALGVGAIVGTGIYTLVGVGADRAGPAVVIAFIIAGLICATAALGYAELSTLIPEAGGAYTYAYMAIGRHMAWIVGWSLILEYSLASSTVAVGWSAYLVGWLHSFGIDLPAALLAGPHDGGIINLPAVIVALSIALLLTAGAKESATLTLALVILKLSALVLFVVLTMPAFHFEYYHPFMPYGFVSHISPDGKVRGVMAAAAILFFAFYGFDTVATAAEETKNPKRDLTIGIIGSMTISVLIYIGVAACLLGAAPFTEFIKSGEPLALILRNLHHETAAKWIAAAALIALPSVIMAMIYGQSRVFFVMARDHLLPPFLAKVNKHGTPSQVTLFTGIIIALIAGFFRLDELAELANAGTLVAFIAVGLSLIILRVREGERTRRFSCPFPFVIGSVTVIGCLYLFTSLPLHTTIRFLLWNAIGLVFYGSYNLYKRKKQKSL